MSVMHCVARGGQVLLTNVDRVAALRRPYENDAMHWPVMHQRDIDPRDSHRAIILGLAVGDKTDSVFVKVLGYVSNRHGAIGLDIALGTFIRM